MSKSLKQGLQYGVSFILGIVLMYYVFRNENLTQIWSDIKNANYYWVLVTYVITFFAHYLRAYRWNLLIQQSGSTIKTSEAFLGLLAGYGANLVLPRMGEITRCAVVSKRQNISFDTTLGTVVAERLFDFISLLLLMVITVIWQYDVLYQFITTLLSQLFGKMQPSSMIILTIILGLLLIIGVLIWKKMIQHSNNLFLLKIKNFLLGLGKGVVSIIEMPNKTSFLISTVLIWICYFLMTYLIFLALPSTSHLAWGAGLSVLVMGAFGIAAPVQGGIGAYHWIVSQTLLLYGLSESTGKTYATLAHASQMALTIVFSLICFSVIAFLKPKNHDQQLLNEQK
jgi:uncharacterized protein (TIRG00374 family)